MMHQTIGIIGYGNMGSAIGQRLKPEYQIWAFDKDKTKTDDQPGVKIADSAADLAGRVDTVILAVKPQDLDALLSEIKHYVVGKLIVSIAAGITSGYIENKLGRIRVIRAMPNLPAKIGQGMTVLCKGKYSGQADLDFAQRLFDCLGKTMLIEENLMNAATAISGSGPGYFYDLIQSSQEKDWKDKVFIPSLSTSAQKIGFTSEQAELLAAVTTQGSVALLQDTGLSPRELCIQVASKGGTTQAGLEALHKTHSLEEAVKAALRRAEELSR